VDNFILEPAGNTLLGTPNLGGEDNIQMDNIKQDPELRNFKVTQFQAY
jgi:hypothetical protein